METLDYFPSWSLKNFPDFEELEELEPTVKMVDNFLDISPTELAIESWVDEILKGKKNDVQNNF